MNISQRIDMIQAVSQDGANCAVQFGGKFRSGGASTDDGNVQSTRPDRFGLSIGAQTGVDQAAVEALRLFGVFQGYREALRARSAEIIGDATDRHDQRVI